MLSHQTEWLLDSIYMNIPLLRFFFFFFACVKRLNQAMSGVESQQEQQTWKNVIVKRRLSATVPSEPHFIPISIVISSTGF